MSLQEIKRAYRYTKLAANGRDIEGRLTQTKILLWQPYTLRSKHMNSYIIYMINNYITTNLILTSAIRILKKLHLYREPEKY
jgi:hypothetical protein